MRGITAALIATLSALVIVMVVWAGYNMFHITSGTVIDKYYEDSSLVCGKGCIYVPECWTIKVDENRFANTACVSESEYNEIQIGDYFEE